MAFDDLRDPRNLHDYIEERLKAKDGKELYLLIDEAQEIQDWARTINSLRASLSVNICVTGSNSKLFAGEDLTYLAGRYVELKMYPLSFGEFKQFRLAYPGEEIFPGDKLHPESTESAFSSYMTQGSFPAVALAKNQEVIRALLDGIVDSVILRDVMQRGGIENESVFRRVASFLFDNVGSEMSANKITSTLKSAGHPISVNTVERYIDLMCNAYLLYRCQRYDIQGRERLRNTPKYYVVDPGLRNAFLGERPRDFGHVIENLVYLELLRRGYEVTTGRIRGKEIDFVAVDHLDRVYIQVCQSLMDESVRDREFSPLFEVRDAYPKYVISRDDVNCSSSVISYHFVVGCPASDEHSQYRFELTRFAISGLSMRE